MHMPVCLHLQVEDPSANDDAADLPGTLGSKLNDLGSHLLAEINQMARMRKIDMTGLNLGQGEGGSTAGSTVDHRGQGSRRAAPGVLKQGGRR